jgi:hypothetical protein
MINVYALSPRLQTRKRNQEFVNPRRALMRRGRRVDIPDLLDITRPTIPATAKKAFRRASA